MVPEAEGGAGNFADEKILAKGAVSLEIEEVRPRHFLDPGLSSCRPRHRNEPLLMGDCRIRTEQNSFDPTEHGGIRANPQGKAENCQYGKAWTPQQLPESEAHILREVLQNTLAASVPALLFDLREPAHRTHSRTACLFR